jgi:hypothetical protein
MRGAARADATSLVSTLGPGNRTRSRRRTPSRARTTPRTLGIRPRPPAMNSTNGSAMPTASGFSVRKCPRWRTAPIWTASQAGCGHHDCWRSDPARCHPKETALQLRANQVADKAVVRGYLIPGKEADVLSPGNGTEVGARETATSGAVFSSGVSAICDTVALQTQPSPETSCLSRNRLGPPGGLRGAADATRCGCISDKTKIVLPGCESEARSGFSTKAVQTRVRVNVTCVTALGEEVASTW